MPLLYQATSRRWFKTVVAGGIAIVAATNLLRSQESAAFDFTDLSIEELGTLNISAASKRSQPLFETAGAVSVVLPQEMARHGFGAVPDALRLVPGVHVAQGNNARWSVGTRGFNGLTSTKLLVLVDGRTIYSPYYGGVDWQNADIHVADLSRIEVVRGPGATLWGANAVNGIINVLSKDARETQGGIFSVRDGTAEDLDVYARFGGQAGERTWYRVFARTESSRHSLSNRDEDGWTNTSQWRTGWRTDSELSATTQLTWQGDIGESEYSTEGVDALTSVFRGNMLGRLVMRESSDETLTVQLYFDYLDGTSRGSNVQLGEGGLSVAEDGYNLDLEVTHRWRISETHDLVWGGGVRRTFTDLDLDGSLLVAEPRSMETLYNFFAQDEIDLVPGRLKLTVGSKLEHHESIGWQASPSARLAYLPSSQQTWWASVSRAIRSPSRSERDSRLTFATIPATEFTPPVRVDLVATPQFQEEELLAWEVGWRFRPVSRITFEATSYVHDYSELRTLESTTTFQPSPPLIVNELHVVNGMAARGYGFEANIDWRINDGWQLGARYTNQRIDPQGIFAPLVGADYALPRQMWSINSWWDVRRDLEFSCGIYRVDEVPELGGSAYHRVDAQLTWRPRLDVRLNIGVQNAAEPSHREYTAFSAYPTVAVPRNFFGSLDWRF